jgi:spore germination protein GerM
MRAALAGVVLGLAVVLAGCGVPTGGEPTTIAPSDFPYALDAPSSVPAAPTPEVVEAPYGVFFVDATEVLVAQPRDVDGSTAEERLVDLLAALADGPTPSEQDARLSTRLPPDTGLSLSDLSGGTATIDLDLLAQTPSGSTSRRAVAQIVLTATTVPGVDAVRLTVGGDPVEAPLPSGELTSAPLTAADYADFLTPPTPTAVPATPS